MTPTSAPMMSSIGRKPRRSSSRMRVGDDRGDDHAGQQRHAEQQRQPDGAAQELREVGRHGGDLAHAHMSQTTGGGNCSRHMFGEIAAR